MWTATRCASSGRSFEFESANRAEDAFKELDLSSGREADKARERAGATGAGVAPRVGEVRRLVVKIRSSTLTTSESTIDYAYLNRMADQIARVREAGWRPVIVTSAAIACGLEALGIVERPRDMPSLQAAASVGQGALSAAYAQAFARPRPADVGGAAHAARHGRPHRLPACPGTRFCRLLELGVVPVVNENDTVSVEQIRFGDNDTLAALVACLIDADLMVILSDIDGLYDANPHRRGRRPPHRPRRAPSTRPSWTWRARPAPPSGRAA